MSDIVLPYPDVPPVMFVRILEAIAEKYGDDINWKSLDINWDSEYPEVKRARRAKLLNNTFPLIVALGYAEAMDDGGKTINPTGLAAQWLDFHRANLDDSFAALREQMGQLPYAQDPSVLDSIGGDEAAAAYAYLEYFDLANGAAVVSSPEDVSDPLDEPHNAIDNLPLEDETTQVGMIQPLENEINAPAIEQSHLAETLPSGASSIDNEDMAPDQPNGEDTASNIADTAISETYSVHSSNSGDANAEYGGDVNADYGDDAEYGGDAEYGDDANAEYGGDAEYGDDANAEYGGDANAEYGDDANAEYGDDANAEYGDDANAEYGDDAENTNNSFSFVQDEPSVVDATNSFKARQRKSGRRRQINLDRLENSLDSSGNDSVSTGTSGSDMSGSLTDAQGTQNDFPPVEPSPQLGARNDDAVTIDFSSPASDPTDRGNKSGYRRRQTTSSPQIPSDDGGMMPVDTPPSSSGSGAKRGQYRRTVGSSASTNPDGLIIDDSNRSTGGGGRTRRPTVNSNSSAGNPLDRIRRTGQGGNRATPGSHRRTVGSGPRKGPRSSGPPPSNNKQEPEGVKVEVAFDGVHVQVTVPFDMADGLDKLELYDLASNMAKQILRDSYDDDA